MRPRDGLLLRRALGLLTGIVLLSLALGVNTSVKSQIGSGDSFAVDVALVLAVDSSASVDFTEFNLQLQGLAHAFRDPDLAEAIGNGRAGAIAVSLMEWSSEDKHEIAIPWTRIGSAEEASAFADLIDATPRRIQTGATSISAAILFAAQMLRSAPYLAERQVIDLSGDGYNNQGPALTVSRELVISQGLTINALALETQVLGLGACFRESLIGGFGAFAISAEDYLDYQGQIRRKLLRELAPPPIS